jgi:hypothetical protein
MKFSLNRFSYIDYDTPYIVIQEIIRCNGSELDIDQIDKNFTAISEHLAKSDYESIELADDYDDKTLDKISLFVSQNETNWDKKNLIKALNHIVNYDLSLDCNFTYGSKTNETPLSYDATMLYSFCIDKGIETIKTDTLEDLSTYVRLSFAKRYALLDALSVKVTQMNIPTIINVLKYSRKRENDFTFSDNTKKILDILKNKEIERSLITDEEAIVTAFRKNGLDISSSTCPSRELIQLQTKQRFIMDDNFVSNYKLNPVYYDINRFWKSHLSSLYLERNITSLLNNECVNHSDISDPKQFLYETTLTKGIYQGLIPGCKYTETYIYKIPFEEINPKYIISYGIMDNCSFLAFTPEEIIDFLNTHKDFRDFSNQGEVMTDRNIKKMTTICKNFPQEKPFSDLLKTIRDIKMLGKVIDSKMKEFMVHLQKSGDGTKGEVSAIFKRLLDLGMYMRGWDGGTEYPLTEEKCRNYAERYDEIETIVLEKMRELNESINALSDTTKILVKSLPLIKLSEKDKSYYRSTNYEEGLSFYERLMLISTNPDSIHACLRLSSNYIISSSQYYNALINNRNFIDINKLEFIQ